MTDELVNAVLQDWRTAKIDEKLRAMLGFLEQLTLAPASIGADNVALLRVAGLSDSAIETAIYICTFFNIIDRLADSLNFHVPSADVLASRAGMLLEHGYRFSQMPTQS